MPHLVRSGTGGARRADNGGWSRLLAWHDSRPRASFATARGWWWGALVAALFFWMSNPLVFEPIFYNDVLTARAWVLVTVALTLPWLRLPRIPWPWLLFLGLALLSRFWTIDEHHTHVSNVIYVQIAAMAFIVAANCTPLVVSWGLGFGGASVVGLSLYAFHRTMYGSTTEIIPGDFQLAGTGMNRNILAYTLTISLAATLAIGLPRRWSARLAWCALIGVHAYGLYRAGSGTGYLTALTLVIAVVSILAWPTLRGRRRHATLTWAAGAFVMLMSGLVLVGGVLGKQLSTLSGRAPFWRATIESTLDTAPVLGSGWGAVWEHPWNLAPPNPVALDIYTRAGYSLPHGHNFFIDVLPELGLAGVLAAVLMVAYAIKEVRRCGLHAGAADPTTGRLVLLTLVALLVSGVTEPMLTVPLGWWSLALVVALPRQGARERVGPEGPPPTPGRRRRGSPSDAGPVPAS